MKYLIVLEETATGYSAYSPDVPGCVATGDRRDEVEREMKGAIALHLDGLKAEGMASHNRAAPRPTSRFPRSARMIHEAITGREITHSPELNTS